MWFISRNDALKVLEELFGLKNPIILFFWRNPDHEFSSVGNPMRIKMVLNNQIFLRYLKEAFLAGFVKSMHLVWSLSCCFIWERSYIFWCYGRIPWNYDLMNGKLSRRMETVGWVLLEEDHLGFDNPQRILDLPGWPLSGAVLHE